jgi:hypothetical protein
VDEARAVLARLDRIEAMEPERDPARLLGEIDLLVVETERWLEREGCAAAAARRALGDCLLALSRASRVRGRISADALVTGDGHSLV